MVSADHKSEGFSLLELVIAMLLFAVIAVAILPLAVQAATLSAVNRDNVEANAFASGQLSIVRTDFPDTADNSCAAVQSKSAAGIVDPAQTGLKADITVSDVCPAFPGVLTVTVHVNEADEPGADPVVTMRSQIVVTRP